MDDWKFPRYLPKTPIFQLNKPIEYRGGARRILTFPLKWIKTMFSGMLSTNYDFPTTAYDVDKEGKRTSKIEKV